MAAFMTSDPIRFAEETTESQVYWNLLFVEKTITKFILIIKEKENSEKYLFVLNQTRKKDRFSLVQQRFFVVYKKDFLSLSQLYRRVYKLGSKGYGKTGCSEKDFHKHETSVH